ncbi:MAG: ketol-acid reductoisomerase [Myxococcota bacterium]
MAKPVLYDRDLPPGLLANKRVGVLGYGSQGQAQALNLRDSGIAVEIGLPEGRSSRARAVADGFAVHPASELAKTADLLVFLTPDETHQAQFEAEIRPALRPGTALVFAHGFSVQYGQVVAPPEVDVLMVAPMGAGPLVRKEYTEGRGASALVAVHQDATGQARALGLGYAQALGAGRVGIMETTFREETETDLFAEQAVLCGGVSSLIHKAFETLTEAGYAEEIAYFCCLHELKFIIDLIQERGIAGMRRRISNTAKYGDLTRGPRVVDAHAKAQMQVILQEIRSGAFAAEWLAESKGGRAQLDARVAEDEAHPIESVGARLRAMMRGTAG